MAKKTIWIAVSVVAAAFSIYFLVPFFFGFWNCSQTFVFPWIGLCLIGPPATGFAVAVLIYTSKLKTAIIGIGTTLAIFGSFGLFPSGADCYTFGLAENFKLTKHPEHIQRWAAKVLDQYENGALHTTTNREWTVGAALEDVEVPLPIKRLWWDKPMVGIVTITDNGWITDPMRTSVATIPVLTGGKSIPLGISHCVSFSWGDRGFLVGRPEFKSTWDPSAGKTGSFYQIKPGIYAYTVGN